MKASPPPTPDATGSLLDARALVSGWLSGEDEFVAAMVREADPDQLRPLCMSLAGMLAGVVTAIADKDGEDPMDLWRRGIESTMRKMGA